MYVTDLLLPALFLLLLFFLFHLLRIVILFHLYPYLNPSAFTCEQNGPLKRPNSLYRIYFTPNIPAWCIHKPNILFDLHSGKKSETSPIILKSRFNELKSNNTNSTYIYTDGSKNDMRVGCAVVSDNYSENMRIPDGSSIFTAEAKAIDLALDFIADFEISNNFIIFSDSLSVLKSLDHTSSKKIHKFKNYLKNNMIYPYIMK